MEKFIYDENNGLWYELQGEGITEQLKASNQIEWVGRMNNISQRTAEVINSDIIYN